MDLASLHPRDGDIIVIIGTKDPVGTGRAIVEVIKRDGVRCGVLTLPEGAHRARARAKASQAALNGAIFVRPDVQGGSRTARRNPRA